MFIVEFTGYMKNGMTLHDNVSLKENIVSQTDVSSAISSLEDSINKVIRKGLKGTLKFNNITFNLQEIAAYEFKADMDVIQA